MGTLQRLSSHFRERHLLASLAVVLVALSTGIFTSAGVQHLHAQAAQARSAQIAVMHVRIVLEEFLVVRRDFDTIPSARLSLYGDFSSYANQARAAVDELGELAPGETHETLSRTLDELIAQASSLRALILEKPNDATAAETYFERQVVPAGTAFRIALTDAETEYASVAESQERWARYGAVAVILIASLVGGLGGAMYDNTRRRTTDLLSRREAHFRTLVQNGADLIAVVDAHGIVTFQSPSMKTLLAKTPEEIEGRSFGLLVHPFDQAIVSGMIQHAELRPNDPISGELRMTHADGSWREVEAIVTNLLDNPDVNGFLITSRDITDRKRMAQQLAHQAFHDTLTGLPNRKLLEDRLGVALKRATPAEADLAVLFLDIDGFKVINDSLGHTEGDALLRVIAHRLTSAIGAGETLARFGGDEFVILLDGAGQSGAIEMAALVESALATPITLGEREFVVTTSIGIVVRTDDRAKPGEMLRCAEMAMYAAKRDGKARHRFYDPSMYDKAWQRLEIESDLRHAIDRNELRTFYQPFVDLLDGEITGVEALVRWERSSGIVPPDQFVPVAEETGLIVEIDHWMLEQACRQVLEWNKERPVDRQLVVSVNISPVVFANPHLTTVVRDTLERVGISPKLVQLEITETVMMREAEITVDTLRRLKSLGVQIAIDDFGTGYSSLAYLQQFPLDVLKIDRYFVQHLGESGDSDEIFRTIVSLAKSLDLSVIGEGVETEAQIRRLLDLGVLFGQGYHFARPLPAYALTERLGQTTQALAASSAD